MGSVVVLPIADAIEMISLFSSGSNSICKPVHIPSKNLRYTMIIKRNIHLCNLQAENMSQRIGYLQMDINVIAIARNEMGLLLRAYSQAYRYMPSTVRLINQAHPH